MGMLKNLRFVFLCCFSLILLVHAQDAQSGFISLDCGRPSNSSYSESTTGIHYISDAAFISTGVSKSVAPAYKATHQLQDAYVRSFPQGVKNCYKVDITKNTKYLIRAGFLYGNYDDLNKLPKFDLVIGASYWDSVAFTDASLSTFKEVVHIPTLDYINVCLLNKGTGTPFISSLELRPLKSTAYVTPTGSLALSFRLDVGSTVNHTYRYPDDALDRFWEPFNFNKWTQLATSHTVDAPSHNDYQVPSIVMRSASTPLDDTMDFNWNVTDTSTQYYIFIHFAELQLLKANQSRSFNITLNGDHWYGPDAPAYLYTTTVFSTSALTGGNYNFSLVQTENSNLPPILNAIEVYTLIDLSQPETDTDDVSAITNIKSTYGADKDWQGDPCTPEGYMWEGLNCTFNGSPRIISLNLSSSGLTGEITSYISDLALLQSLDLSNNSLKGSIPEFLSKMPNLKVLNLEGNKLNGSVPADLIERSKSGSLSLSVEENADLCIENSCKKEETEKKKKNIIVPIVAAIGGFFILVVLVVAIFMWLKRGRKQQVVTAVSHQPNNQVDSFESKKRQFTYSDVLQITNNFQTIIGRGGYGKVYHGFVDDTQVAVKMLSPTSGQGYQEFQAEVKLLIRVHHRNLTSLVGYCNEGTNMALIYEFMAYGSLDSHLLGENSNANVLTWEGRLQIATDAAQGLEYLHNGCKPPIVHRDVKTTNILLAENFQAKLADFGLSRIFPTDGGTHMSTAVAGTPGYLDPEYHTTGWLNEKSDVYSFGVVLLEIITGRPAISRTQEKIRVSQWVSSMLARGDIKTILDARLRGDYDINSAWKAVELAMNCVSNTSNKRPNMSEVVRGLKDCLEAELARTNFNRVTESTDSVIYPMNVNAEFSPLVR